MAATISQGPYQVGQVVHLADAVTVTSSPTDVGVLVLSIKKPDGTIVTPALVHDGVGGYHYDLTVDMAGLYSYKFLGTGAAAGANESTFSVLTVETA